MGKLYIKERHLDVLKTIFNEKCPKAIIYAYGSRVKGDAHDGSDLDLAIVLGEDDKPVVEIKEAIQESNLPFLVDIFELNTLPESFRSEIEKDNVIIKD